MLIGLGRTNKEFLFSNRTYKMSLVPFQNFPEGFRRSKTHSARGADRPVLPRSRTESVRPSDNETKKNHPRRSRKSKEKSDSDSEWITRVSKTTGKPFYVNKTTKERTYTMPERLRTRKSLPTKLPSEGEPARTTPARKSQTKKSPEKEVWVKYVSRKTGLPFYYNTLTKVSSYTNPDAPPVIEDGYEVTIDKRGHKLYYDPATDITHKVKPFPKYPPDSVEALRLSAEDRVLNQLGIKSCKQIRLYLENTSMTEEEQVTFIQIHAKDTSDLRKLLKSGEFNSDQFRMLGELGSEAILKLKAQVISLVKSTEEEPKTEEDIECAELRKKVELFHKNNPAISKSHWKRIIDKAKQTVAYIIEYVKKIGYEAFMLFWNNLPSLEQIRVGIFWFVQKGIDISIWIASNPKTAYYVIYGFIQAKHYMCKAIGVALNMIGIDPNELDVVKKIRKAYPKATDPNEKEKMSSALYDALRPYLEEGMIKSTSYVSKSAMLSLKTFITTGASTVGTSAAVSAVTGSSAVAGAATVASGLGTTTAVVGSTTAVAGSGTLAAGSVVATGGAMLAPMAVVAVSAILYTAATAALDYGIEKVEETAEQITALNEIRNNYNKLIELADPMPCLKQILTITEGKARVDTDFNIKLYHELGRLISAALPTQNASLESDIDVEKISTAYKHCLHSHHSKKFREAENMLTQYSQYDAKLLPKLGYVKFYAKEDFWIQAAVYIWLSERISRADQIAEFGPILQIDIDKQKEKISAEAKAQKFAKNTTKLETWKLQFDNYKETWDKEPFTTAVAADTIGEDIVAMLTQDISADFDEFTSSLDTSKQIEVATLKKYMTLNEYAYKAIAIKQLYDTLKSDQSKPLAVRFPPWINGCVRSIRETLSTENQLAAYESKGTDVPDTLKNTSRLILWKGQAPFEFSLMQKKISEFNRYRREARQYVAEKGEAIERIRGEFSSFLDQSRVNIEAYKRFMGRESAPDEEFPRLVKLIIEPLRYFEEEMAKDDKRSAARKANIKLAAQNVVDRMCRPRVATDMVGFEKAFPELTRETVVQKLKPIATYGGVGKGLVNNNYYLIISALFLQRMEFLIYGASLIADRIGKRDIWKDHMSILPELFGSKVPMNKPFQDSQHNSELSFYDYAIHPSTWLGGKQATNEVRIDKAGEEIIGKDYTQMIATRAFIRCTIISNSHFPASQNSKLENAGEMLKDLGLFAAAYTAGPLVLGVGAALGENLLGIDGMVRGAKNTLIKRRNAYLAVYNQDIPIEDQNNNPTVSEIFEKLNFPPPAIHPDHWTAYFKLSANDPKFKAVNNFARSDACSPKFLEHAYVLIGYILAGTRIQETAVYRRLAFTPISRAALFGGEIESEG